MLTSILIVLNAYPILASTDIFGIPADSNKTTVVNGTEQPNLPYVTTWVDRDGGTHIQNCKILGEEFKAYAPPASPEWIGIAPDDVESVRFAALPVGYTGSWHVPPGPQWVITISGQWSVETTDGSKITQGPGEVMFNDDHSSRPRPNDTRVGHYTNGVGNVPNVQLIIRLKTDKGPRRNGHCAF